MEKPSDAVIVAICGTAAYIAYVACTHADGLVFGGFCTFLGACGGVVYAARAGSTEKK